jgi:glycerol kinase
MAEWFSTNCDAIPGGCAGVPVIRPQVTETTALGGPMRRTAVDFWKNLDELRLN